MNNTISPKNRELFIGVLSGTSLDAVDVALVEFNEKGQPCLLATHQQPMPSAMAQQCLQLTASDNCRLSTLGTLDHELGQLFANAVLYLLRRENISAEMIIAIGSHGQTLWHQPDGKSPFTLQIGDPNIIAQKTGITTVADFRRRDMAAGGQGAPLAPALHHALFTNKNQRIIVNVGGISNITLLTPTKAVIGFDCGPGNGLLDQCVQKYWKQPFDKDGKLAREGHIDQRLLQQLLTAPYFSCPPPKSTGREVFHLGWVEQQMSTLNLSLAPQDLLATLLALTVETIAIEIKKYANQIYEVFICGGGAHNKTFMEQLSQKLSHDVQTTQTLGISPDWIEGILFAWLARQTTHGLAGNIPTVTGATQAVSLGAIYPGNIGSFTPKKSTNHSINRKRTTTTTSCHGIGIADNKTSTL